jgi:hypothetical protein
LPTSPFKLQATSFIPNSYPRHHDRLVRLFSFPSGFAVVDGTISFPSFKAIFGLLVTEIVTLTAILGPLPLFARKQLVKIQTSTNYVIGALSYGVKLGLMYVYTIVV